MDKNDGILWNRMLRVSVRKMKALPVKKKTVTLIGKVR
jgi:hypothetical protein